MADFSMMNINDYPEYQVDTYQLLCDVILVYGRMVNLLKKSVRHKHET